MISNMPGLGLGVTGHSRLAFGLGTAVLKQLLVMRFETKEPAMAGQSKGRDQTHTTVEVMRKL